jgi:8-oxo-dGTP diphosphatase
MIDEYTVGFAFDDHSNVALIRKATPAWQMGHLNGIGGHVDRGETPRQGMVREFYEEAGVVVRSWKHFVTMRSDEWDVYVFVARGVDLTRVKTMTIEEVVVVPAHHLPSIVLPQLRWLVPMAFDYGYVAGGYFREGQTNVYFEKTK